MQEAKEVKIMVTERSHDAEKVGVLCQDGRAHREGRDIDPET